MKTEAYFRSFFNYWCLTPLMLDLFVFLAGTNGDGRECRTKAYIVPPHAIRCYVDKAAPYVAQLGEACEKKIMEKHAGNANFSFLNASDPYHAYYQHCLAEARVKYQGLRKQPTQPEVSALTPLLLIR